MVQLAARRALNPKMEVRPLLPEPILLSNTESAEENERNANRYFDCLHRGDLYVEVTNNGKQNTFQVANRQIRAAN